MIRTSAVAGQRPADPVPWHAVQAYLSSLDSVRFPGAAWCPDGGRPRLPRQPDARWNLAVAEADVLLQLMFGIRVVLPEPLMFDSVAVARIAKGLLPRDSHGRREIWPFYIAWRPGNYERFQHEPSGTFYSMFAARMQNEDFYLSSLPGLTAQHREELARIALSQPDDLPHAIGDLVYQGPGRESPQDVSESLTALWDYVTDSRVPHGEAPNRGRKLEEYARYVARHRTRLVRSLPDHERPYAMKLIDTISRDQTLMTSNQRSALYWRADQLGCEVGDLDLARGLVEFEDAAYGRVIASSTGAHQAVHTAFGSPGGVYQQIALKLIHLTAPEPGRRPPFGAAAGVRVTKSRQRLRDMLGNMDWAKVRDNLLRSERFGDSLRALQESFRGGSQLEREGAVKAHVATVRKILVDQQIADVKVALAFGVVRVVVRTAAATVDQNLLHLPLLRRAANPVVDWITTRVRYRMVENAIRPSLEDSSLQI